MNILYPGKLSTFAFVTLCVGSAACAQVVDWQSIVNTMDQIPGTSQTFSSFNQPSINSNALVVFRARSTGPNTPLRGIWLRDMGSPGSPIIELVTTGDVVPDPNNNEIPPGSGVLASFNEFPSFPRIEMDSDFIGTRGQHEPVWKYELPDGSETNVGTAGIYAAPQGDLITGASLLGAVRDADTSDLVFPWFQVPGAPEGTRFDQFPGAPALSNGRIIVFKGNYTDETGEGRTGIFYRDLVAQGGMSPTALVADSTMLIPNQVKGGGVTFGSTAPPSAAMGKVVFLGLDNEEEPTLGGIYLADIQPTPELEALVEIGGQVPGEPVGTGFTRLGEALSFDGRFVAFWGAWGTEYREVLLECPTDGNQNVIRYCLEEYPDGYIAQVPVNQGMFVYDTQTGQAHRVARTGAYADDFLFWVFSGRVLRDGGGESGDEEEELARWRSSAFLAVEGLSGNRFRVAFKAASGDEEAILLTEGPGDVQPVVLIDSNTPGTFVDDFAPVGSVVTIAGLERDALRNGRLAIAASMEDDVTEESLAGLYVADVSDVVLYPAELTDWTVVYGSHVTGGLDELVASDNAYLRTRSGFGFSAQEANLMEMHVGAVTDLPSADVLALTIESRINNPGGTARVRLHDWSSDQFEEVSAYAIGTTEETVEIPGIDAHDYVRAGDSRIEVSLRHAVVAIFAATGFESSFDQVRMNLR